MNQRIKEFEKQCWSHRIDGFLMDGQLHFDTQKFALLIVRECGRVYIQNQQDGVMTLTQDLLQHFGVEE